MEDVGVIAEEIAEKIVVEDHQDQPDLNLPNRTEQMIYGLMNGKYLFDTLKTGLKELDHSKDIKSGVFVLWGKEIIRLLTILGLENTRGMDFTLIIVIIQPLPIIQFTIILEL